MTAFDVRLASIQRRAWPAEPPVLPVLDAVAPLLVPLGGREAQVIAVRPAGTKVRVGQMLTETAPEAGHVPVAPVDGTLGAVRTVMVAGGVVVPAVELVPAAPMETLAPADPADAASEQSTHMPAGSAASLATTFTRAELPAWIDRLRGAGLHADRTASPDLIAQLLAVLRRPVDTIICNVLDGDPPLRLLAALALHEAETLIGGVGALRDLCGATSAVVVIDDSAPARWVRELRKAARARRVRLITRDNDYPQGDPTLLLLDLSGRKLRFRRLPVEQGVVILDAAAAVAVGRFLRDQRPMTHVPVGIFDHAADGHVRDRLHLVMAPIGMRLDDLLGQLPVNRQSSTLRAGDLLRDRRIEGETVIGGGELVVHLLPHEPAGLAEPCIRCGWCVQGCPTNVQPAGLLDAAQQDDLKLAEHYGLESCIECGICSFVCPSRLPLLGGIRHLRTLRRM